MLAELKNIHRLLERILESSRDNSGHINMVMLVDRLWSEANFSYYIIGIDLISGLLDSGQMHHCGHNIRAGFYLPFLPTKEGPELEKANPHVIENTLIYFLNLPSEEHKILAIAFRPQLEEDIREIFFSTLRFMIQQQLHYESITDEFQQARQVQTSLFPQRFDVSATYDIFCLSRPCQVVSGDAYDLIRVDDESVLLMIADALGHGFPAALQARDVIIGLRMGFRKGSKLSVIMEDLNRIVCQTKLASRFVSVFCGELESNGNLFYVNAGHIPPLCLQGDQVSFTDVRNLAIGPQENTKFKMGFFHLERSDLLALYTDGIVECSNEREEQFGRERLVNLLRKLRQESAKEIVEAVFAEVEQFAGGEQEDDMTLMLVKRK